MDELSLIFLVITLFCSLLSLILILQAWKRYSFRPYMFIAGFYILESVWVLTKLMHLFLDHSAGQLAWNVEVIGSIAILLSYFLFALGIQDFHCEQQLPERLIFLALCTGFIIFGYLNQDLFYVELRNGQWKSIYISIIFSLGVFAVMSLQFLEFFIPIYRVYRSQDQHEVKKDIEKLVIAYGCLIIVVMWTVVSDKIGVPIFVKYIFLSLNFVLITYVLYRRPIILGISMTRTYRLVISRSSIPLFSYDFIEMEGEEAPELIDPNLFSAAFSGISNLVRESLDSNKSLRVIDHEDKKIIIEPGRIVTAYLIISQETKLHHLALKLFLARFEKYFEEELSQVNPEIPAFQEPGIQMAEELFSFIVQS